MTTTRKSTGAAFVKAIPTEGELDVEGSFEAVVSVFGNVDAAGDIVVAGAFTKSLDRWAASGDPIPVIFSHRWDDLDAHVGVVTHAKELPAGDPQLPAELTLNGGLYIRGRLDVEEPFASRLWKRLQRRSLREFSFAYDVLDGRPNDHGGDDLYELDVIEVGPTLKGANPATELIGAKAAELLKGGGDTLDASALGELVDAVLEDAEELAVLEEALDVDELNPAELEVAADAGTDVDDAQEAVAEAQRLDDEAALVGALGNLGAAIDHAGEILSRLNSTTDASEGDTVEGDTDEDGKSQDEAGGVDPLVARVQLELDELRLT